MQLHLDKLHTKKLSWSCFSSWKFNKEKWALKYLEGIIEKPNEKMIYGNVIGDKLSSDADFLPEVPRYSVFEKKLDADLSGLKLTGYLDSFDPETKAFYEYKTSSNDNTWTHTTANKHGQILMYMALIWKVYETKPEDIKCSLHYIPVEEYFDLPEASDDGDIFSEANKPVPKMRLKEGENILHFDIKHSSIDVLKFLKEVQSTYKDMESYALAYNPEKSIV